MPIIKSSKRWLILIGLAMVLVLAAVGAIQVRQASLLDSTARFMEDDISWGYFQLETESMRFRESLYRALDAPEAMDFDDLSLRYEIFVSRQIHVGQGNGPHPFSDLVSYDSTMQKVNAFFEATDPYLGENPLARPDAAALKKILRNLDTLREPLHLLSLAASDLVGRLSDKRSNEVRRQITNNNVLSGFQYALTLLFAIIVILQIRKLESSESKLRSLAEDLKKTSIEADSANREKSTFLANMSHEIRTPLNGMLGMLALLKKTYPDPEQTDLIETAQDSSHHLLAILNNILDISKLESGKIDIEPAPYDMHQLLQQVVTLIRVSAAQKQLTLGVRVDPALPKYLYGDSMRIRQILFNLLNNAVKFTDTGYINVSAIGRVEADGTRILMLAVADTGIGMSQSSLEKLFQRFSQGDSSTDRRFGGTGLGLEISRSLARLMGGDISVDSKLGQGSTFNVDLPLLAVDPSTTPELAAVEQAAIPLTGSRPPRLLRVLVADDNAVNRKYLDILLRKLGHEAVFCENGKEVVEIMQARQFDVILMDVHMPLMDGLAATRAIRKMPLPCAGIKIIAVTADVFSESREQALKIGMDDFLTKPFTVHALTELFSRHFQVEKNACASLGQ